MQIEHHDLHHEFPEYGDKIRELKMNNAHFNKLFNEYHELTNKVEQIEANDSPVNDLDLEEKKKVRLKLKDELYKMLRA